MFHRWAVALATGAAVSASAAAPLVVSDGRVRLGVADSPEWDTFANDPPQAHRLDVRFQAETNEEEATLRIRQDDVKQEWAVQLNGKRLGKLFLMEADLFHRLPIPGSALRAGENLLSIFQTAPNVPDDIVLHEIAIERDPPESGLLKVTVLVDDEEGVPCRVTVVDQHGTLSALLSAENANAAIPANLAVRPGVVYTADGRVTISLPVGRYTLFASRGLEFGFARADVEVLPNTRRDVRLALRREVATPGWVSCDTHTHTFTHSGHGDATVEERVLTIAGEGIELPVATDHNLHVDLAETAARRGVNRYFTPVIGNEVTTAAGHFNIFPIAPGAPVVDAKITDWSRLIPAMRKTPGVQMIVLNHPRSIHSGFRPFDPAHFNAVTGGDRRGVDFAFDALELVNSGAQQSDYMRVYRDWFALLNHGHRVVGVGASDSHDVSRFIVGQARTYIAAADDHPGSIDVDEACANLRAGRALVSMGLFAEMIVNGSYRAGDIARAARDELHVELRIFAPSWSRATEAVVYANGIPVSEIPVEQSTGDAPPRAEGNSTRIIRTIRRVRHDVHLVAIVTGPAVTAPFWAMTKPYQPNSRQWTGRAIASTNPIWVDADRDGQFTSAREYARQVVARHTEDPTALFAELAQYDEAVAAQAASLLAAGGVAMSAAPFVAAQKGAAPHVIEGFAKWLAAEEAGRAALLKLRE